MNLDFNIGACSAKAVLLDGGDRPVAVVGARRAESFQPRAAFAALFVKGRARWRRLAFFAKEISQ